MNKNWGMKPLGDVIPLFFQKGTLLTDAKFQFHVEGSTQKIGFYLFLNLNVKRASIEEQVVSNL